MASQPATTSDASAVNWPQASPLLFLQWSLLFYSRPHNVSVSDAFLLCLFVPGSCVPAVQTSPSTQPLVDGTRGNTCGAGSTLNCGVDLTEWLASTAPPGSPHLIHVRSFASPHTSLLDSVLRIQGLGLRVSGLP